VQSDKNSTPNQINASAAGTPANGAPVSGALARTGDASDNVETRLLLVCQSEGLRNRYADLAGYEESDDNSGLTALGWEQTNQLANWLKSHEKVDVLISGPQLRSRLTAQRIGQFIGQPVKVRFDLPRYAYASAMRPPVAGEMPRLLANLAERAQTATHEPADPEYVQFAAEATAVIDQIMSEYWGKCILVVMGGMTVAAIIRQFFGSHTLPIVVTHSGITEFVRRNGQWWLTYVNRREHMPVPAGAWTQTQGGTPAAPESSAIDNEELSRIVEVYNRVGQRLLTGQPPIDRGQRLRDLLRFAHLPAEMRILDIGTGDGQLPMLLAEEGAREVVGIDINPIMLESAEYLRLSRSSATANRVNFRLAPAQALPFSDEWFDVVFVRLVTHHSAKPERILQEATRVLKSGGVLILADLLGADDPVRRATQNAIEEKRNPSYVAARTAEQYRKLVINAGLTIENEKMAVFEREMDEWLADMEADAQSRTTVRDMLEAGIETDASGLQVRRQGMKLLFEQRFLYVRAVKR